MGEVSTFYKFQKLELLMVSYNISSFSPMDNSLNDDVINGEKGSFPFIGVELGKLRASLSPLIFHHFSPMDISSTMDDIINR